jgi:CRISPR-associated protein Cas1
MIIVIDDFGVSLEREKGCFLISKGEEKRQISPQRVTGIQVRKTCMLSSAALMLASEHGIPVLMYDFAGKVKARVWQPHFGSHAQVRHGQLTAAQNTDGLAWVREGILLKADVQMSVLKWLGDRVPAQHEDCRAALAAIESQREMLAKCALEDEGVRSGEALIGRIYWSAYFTALEHKEAADKRSRRPAEDPLNAMLNYGYGMLYGEVESCALIAGLDPHIGFMHRDEYGKPAFVFDAIEPFRPWVDRLVAGLILGGAYKKTWFDETTAKKADQAMGVLLTKVGKQEFIPAWQAMMMEPTLFNNKKIKRRDQIQHRLTALAQTYLKNKEGMQP